MTLEEQTIRKVTVRLIPFLMVCYFVAYLDRVNVGFAKFGMSSDIGLSDSAYGLGAGIFFIPYFFCDVPANLLLDRFGARKWIARIMFTWGIVTGGMALVVGDNSFYFMRVILGVAEAGFFPGIIFYLTLWFPASHRGRMIGAFMAAIPISSVIGAPLSGQLLLLEGWLGLHGWQWLFILEGVPAVVLSVFVYYYLTDRPSDAHWLTPHERAWLVDRMAREEAQRSAQHLSVLQSITSGRVLAAAVAYFGVVGCLYGFSFFLPTIIKDFGLTITQTSLVVAVPYAVGAVGMVLWGRRSDQLNERKFHTGVALLLASTGLAAAALLTDPLWKTVAFSVSGLGIFAALPLVWTLPTAFLSGAAAASGIAVVNAIGNLSGFAAPFAIGVIKDRTGSYTGGLLLIAACGAMSLVIVTLFRHDRNAERITPLPGK